MEVIPSHEEFESRARSMEGRLIGGYHHGRGRPKDQPGGDSPHSYNWWVPTRYVKEPGSPEPPGLYGGKIDFVEYLPQQLDWQALGRPVWNFRFLAAAELSSGEARKLFVKQHACSLTYLPVDYARIEFVWRGKTVYLHPEFESYLLLEGLREDWPLDDPNEPPRLSACKYEDVLSSFPVDPALLEDPESASVILAAQAARLWEGLTA